MASKTLLRWILHLFLCRSLWGSHGVHQWLAIRVRFFTNCKISGTRFLNIRTLTLRSNHSFQLVNYTMRHVPHRQVTRVNRIGAGLVNTPNFRLRPRVTMYQYNNNTKGVLRRLMINNNQLKVNNGRHRFFTLNKVTASKNISDPLRHKRLPCRRHLMCTYGNIYLCLLNRPLINFVILNRRRRTTNILIGAIGST